MLGTLALPFKAPRHGPIRVMVRPWAWRVCSAARDGLAGRVLRCSYLGRQVEYLVHTAMGSILVVSNECEAMRQPAAPVSLMLGTRGVALWIDQGSPASHAAATSSPPTHSPRPIVQQGDR
jgi:iron(III) transport system ATP-binding protein